MSGGGGGGRGAWGGLLFGNGEEFLGADAVYQFEFYSH